MTNSSWSRMDNSRYSFYLPACSLIDNYKGNETVIIVTASQDSRPYFINPTVDKTPGNCCKVYSNSSSWASFQTFRVTPGNPSMPNRLSHPSSFIYAGSFNAFANSGFNTADMMTYDALRNTWTRTDLGQASHDAFYRSFVLLPEKSPLTCP